MPLTKSLNTVTAVSHVARYILLTRPALLKIRISPESLTGSALDALGLFVSSGWMDALKHDEMVKRCVIACSKVLQEAHISEAGRLAAQDRRREAKARRLRESRS